MILEDMMKDGRRITFDCVFQAHGECCTVGGGVNKIEMDDIFYGEKEVQSAIRQGLVKVVGEAPLLPVAIPKPKERRVRLQNAWHTKLAFDCVHDYVDAGKVLSVDESALRAEEIRNALESGMLINLDAPRFDIQVGPAPDPSTVTELVADDVVEARPTPEKADADVAVVEDIGETAGLQGPTGRPQARPDGVEPPKPTSVPKPAVARARAKAKATSPIKAKKIGSVADRDESPLDASDEDDGLLFKESKIAVAKTTPPPSKEEERKAAVSQDVLDFIFGEEK